MSAQNSGQKKHCQVQKVYYAQRPQPRPGIVRHIRPPFCSAHSVRGGGEEYARGFVGKLETNYGSEGRFPGKDVCGVVKGITRQVILVKSPDPKLFEEAIFIVKEEAMHQEGITAEQVIRQARKAADGYLKGNRIRKSVLERFAGPVWGVGGAVMASVGWYAALVLR